MNFIPKALINVACIRSTEYFPCYSYAPRASPYPNEQQLHPSVDGFLCLLLLCKTAKNMFAIKALETNVIQHTYIRILLKYECAELKLFMPCNVSLWRLKVLDSQKFHITAYILTYANRMYICVCNSNWGKTAHIYSAFHVWRCNVFHVRVARKSKWLWNVQWTHE